MWVEFLIVQEIDRTRVKLFLLLCQNDRRTYLGGYFNAGAHGRGDCNSLEVLALNGDGLHSHYQVDEGLYVFDQLGRVETQFAHNRMDVSAAVVAELDLTGLVFLDRLLIDLAKHPVHLLLHLKNLLISNALFYFCFLCLLLFLFCSLVPLLLH